MPQNSHYEMKGKLESVGEKLACFASCFGELLANTVRSRPGLRGG